MILGGFQPLTLLDYPGRVACIVFTQGCNLRCGYCHNPQLLPPTPKPGSSAPTAAELFAILEARRNMLDGVVVTGGEPTIQPDLLDFLARVKSLGYQVKLDTNGTNPAVLAQALERKLVDYVAMDVKHDPARYAEITAVDVDPSALAASRDLLLRSDVASEFRTTVVPHLHDPTTMERIARFCAGASRLVLQGMLPDRAWLPQFRNQRACSRTQLGRLWEIVRPFVASAQIACYEG